MHSLSMVRSNDSDTPKPRHVTPETRHLTPSFCPLLCFHQHRRMHLHFRAGKSEATSATLILSPSSKPPCRVTQGVFMRRLLALSPLVSVTHPENTITRLFSSTHWEHFFCPFVFNQPLGAIFIFNISTGGRLPRAEGLLGIVAVGS